MDSQTAKLLPALIPLVIIALVLRRNLGPRKLQVERMWLFPVLLVVAIGSEIYATPPTTLVGVGALVVALLLGAVAGWYRGRLTHITIDPMTHELTSQASVVGLVLIGVLFAVRYGLRFFLEAGSAHAALGATAGVATDALLAFSVGMMCVTRLEMWMRASKMLADAIAAKQTSEVSS